MLRFLKLISVTFALVAVSAVNAAERFYPDSAGQTVRCRAMIEMPRGAVSGMCLLRNDTTEVRGCIFNEFGITAFGFTYDTRRGKVKLEELAPMFDKWYIRRTLRSDLRELMRALDAGADGYINEKRKIKYKLIPLDE